jgi:hypothetical protein
MGVSADDIRWIAIRKSNDGVIAAGESYLECSDAATAASGWNRAPGTVAPYFITTDLWFSSPLHTNLQD